MEQRDYILREIEKISVLLLGLLGRLRRAERRQLFEEERALIDDDLSKASGLTIDDLLSIDTDKIASLLSSTPGMESTNLEKLAEILYLFANNCAPSERLKLLKRAAAIISFVDNESRTFSFERAALLSEIEDAIEHCS